MQSETEGGGTLRDSCFAKNVVNKNVVNKNLVNKHLVAKNPATQNLAKNLVPRDLAPVNGAPTGLAPLSLVIASEVRFVRESLGQVLARDGSLCVVGYAEEARGAVELCRELRPRIALIDATVRDGAAAVRQLRDDGAGVKVVVFAVGDNVESVLDWAEAGIAGYIPSDAALDDLLDLLNGILNGRQCCSSAISAGLLRRLGSASAISAARPQDSNRHSSAASNQASSGSARNPISIAGPLTAQGPSAARSEAARSGGAIANPSRRPARP